MARVGQTVGALLHEDHEAVGVVGELDPRAHDPTVGVGVEAVVVVAVDLAQRVVVALRLELDHAHAAEVGADRLDLGDDRSGTARAFDVNRPPLSGRSSPGFQKPRQSSSPSAVAIGREVGVAAALPVHVLEPEVLRLGDRPVEVAQHDVAVLGERVDPRVRRVERDVGGPVRAPSASAR